MTRRKQKPLPANVLADLADENQRLRQEAMTMRNKATLWRTRAWRMRDRVVSSEAALRQKQAECEALQAMVDQLTQRKATWAPPPPPPV